MSDDKMPERLEKIYEQALLDIIDPIGKIIREMPEGYKLDGYHAAKLRDDPNYLRSIAEAAIRKAGE